MKTDGWLAFIALELAVIIAAILYGAYKANSAIASAQASPLAQIFGGL